MATKQTKSHNPPSSKRVPEHERDPHLWFNDGDILIQIGNERFARIHRSLLRRHSPLFDDVLRDITATILISNELDLAFDDGDFRELLEILYPVNFTTIDDMKVEKWKMVLRASINFQFPTIRQLAIEQLTGKAPPVDKIVMGRVFDVPELLVDGCISLCRRFEPLTLREGEELGVHDAVRVMRAREEVLEKNKKESESIVRGIFELGAKPPRKTAGTSNDSEPPKKKARKQKDKSSDDLDWSPSSNSHSN